MAETNTGSIGSLSVEIGADVSGFTAGLNGARTALVGLSGEFGAASAVAVAAGAAVMGFGIVASAALLTTGIAVKTLTAAFRDLAGIIASVPRDITINVRAAVSGGGVGARAAGGPVSASTPYLVGERGPEIFLPGSSGSIVPNSQIGGTGVFGGSGATINIQQVHMHGVQDVGGLLEALQEEAGRHNIMLGSRL